MGMMENSPTSLAPLLLRNLMTSIFIYADKSLVNLGEKYKLLEIIRSLLVTFVLFFLRLLPSVLLSPNSNPDGHGVKPNYRFSYVQPCGRDGDTGIARALSQLLSTVTDLPVCSRKYEVVRSLADKLIDENHSENVAALGEVNRTALSAAFARTLSLLEAGLVELERDRGEYGCWGAGPGHFVLNRVFRAARSVGGGVWNRIGSGREEMNQPGISAEKLASELLWLVQKMAACGFVEEAVARWASASNLACLTLLAEPRLQCSVVKVAAFLLKQAKDMGTEEAEEAKKEQEMETKMKLLMSWLPLLCRSSNGTDVPVLNSSERAELETVLERSIEMLEEEKQEQVLSLWLHHFTRCPSSDWPNLHGCYTRWCTASRKLLLLQSMNN